MTKFEKFEKQTLNSVQSVKGGTATGAGKYSYTDADGCTVSYSYLSDCEGTDGMVMHCQRYDVKTTCP